MPGSPSPLVTYSRTRRGFLSCHSTREHSSSLYRKVRSADGHITVLARGDSLFTQSPDSPEEVPLIGVSATRFIVRGPTGLVFTLVPTGEVHLTEARAHRERQGFPNQTIGAVESFRTRKAIHPHARKVVLSDSEWVWGWGCCCRVRPPRCRCHPNVYGYGVQRRDQRP